MGRTALGYFHLLGGMIITARKGASDNCFLGTPCYSSEPLDAPFYNISLPGGGHFSVPYNSDWRGYTVSVPTSASQETVDALLKAYAPLFGDDTREIWLNAVLFNPNGHQTVTSFAYGGQVSLSRVFSGYTELMTIPAQFYQPHMKSFQIICELALVVYFLSFIVRPSFKWYRGDPEKKEIAKGGAAASLLQSEAPSDLGDADKKTLADLRKKWYHWCDEWKQLPSYGGMPILGLSNILSLVFFVAIIFYVCLFFFCNSIGADGDNIFEVSKADSANGLAAKMSAAGNAMEKITLPNIAKIHLISRLYSYYYFIHVILTLMLVLRLQQYLQFQRRLSVVADTFWGITDEVMHVGLVLISLCFFFGAMFTVACGLYDTALTNFTDSFGEMLLGCFGLFKPAGTAPFILSLFKYGAHTLNDSEFMSWVPQLIQIFFKAVVLLLIFKLFMGVVMESYKAHTKAKGNAPTVRVDLRELIIQMYHYLWEHKIMKRPWVPFFQVAMALGRLEKSNRPFEEFFLGLDHWSRVQTALNNVVEADYTNQPHVKAKVDSMGCKVCEQADVEYVLKAYGINRVRAEAMCVDAMTEKAQPKKTQPKAKAKPKAKDDLSAKFTQEQLQQLQIKAINEVHDQIGAARRNNQNPLGKMEEDAKISMSPFSKFEDARLERIFNDFDAERLGVVDRCYMPLVFRTMGINIKQNKLAKLLEDHNPDQDRDTSLEEFKSIVHDLKHFH
jgi:hypothetical protein